jgi:hypothetical protein
MTAWRAPCLEQAGARLVSRPSAPEFWLLLADGENSLRQLKAASESIRIPKGRGRQLRRPSPETTLSLAESQSEKGEATSDNEGDPAHRFRH